MAARWESGGPGPLPPGRLAPLGYHGDHRGGDGKMGEGTGGGTMQGLLSSPELGLNVSRPVSPGLAV